MKFLCGLIVFFAVLLLFPDAVNRWGFVLAAGYAGYCLMAVLLHADALPRPA